METPRILPDLFTETDHDPFDNAPNVAFTLTEDDLLAGIPEFPTTDDNLRAFPLVGG